MKNTDVIIRELTIDDARTYAEFIVKNDQTSGVGDTPIFSIFSRHDLVDIDEKVERLRKSFTIPLGTPGWARRWGAFTKEGRLGGDVALVTSRLPPAQMHRVVLGISLDLEFRGRGLGGELMATALDWAKSQSLLAWVDLGVFAHNAPARRLYERFGFRETGRTTDSFRVDEQRIDDIQMTLELSQYSGSGHGNRRLISLK